MNGRLRIPMKMTLCLPLPLDVLFPPLSCLILQVCLMPSLLLLSNLIISTPLAGFSSAWVSSFVTQGSPLPRTRTSRRKKMLQNTPTTLGSLTRSGSRWGPLCSRAVTSLRGNGGQKKNFRTVVHRLSVLALDLLLNLEGTPQSAVGLDAMVIIAEIRHI